MADYTLSVKMTGDASNLEKAFSKAQSSIDKVSKKMGSTGSEITQSMEAAATASSKSLKQIAEEQGKTVNQLRSEVAKIAAEYKKAGMDASSAMKKAYADIGYQADATIEKIKKGARESKSAYESLAKSLDGVSKKLATMSGGLKTAETAMNDIGKMLMPVSAAVKTLGASTVKTAIDFLSLKENTRVAFKVLLGSAEAAEQMLEDLYKFALTTPFSYDTYLTAGKVLMAMGVAANECIPYLEGITNAAIATGYGQVGVNSLSEAIGRMSSKGKIQLEELNRFMEMGIPAVKILGNAYGVTGESIYKMMETGELLASDALPKLLEGMNEGTDGVNGATAAYGGLAKEMKGTLSGAMDSLNSKFRNMAIGIWNAEEAYPELINTIQTFTASLDVLPAVFASVSQAAVPVLEVLTEKLNKLAEYIQNASPEQLQRIGDVILGLAAAVPALMLVGTGLQKFSGFIEGISKISDKVGILVTAIGKAGGASSFFSGKAAAAFSALTGPVGIAVMAITSLTAAFAYLMSTNEAFRSSIMDSFDTIKAAVLPVITQLGELFKQIGGAILQVVTTVLQGLAPAIAQIVSVIAQVIAMIAPFISQLISSLLPTINTITNVLMNIIQAAMLALLAIVNAVMTVIEAVAPVVMNVLSIVVDVVNNIMQALSPIIGFIGGLISTIIAIIAPVVTVVANVIAAIVQIIGQVLNVVTGVFSTIFSVISETWTKAMAFTSGIINKISSLISSISSVVSTVFNGIYSVCRSVMDKVDAVIKGVFDSIRSTWEGLTGFVDGIFSGIEGAVNELVGQVKGFVNGVIGGINVAVGLINKIPGVSISEIPYLARGTDDFQGGFARINEGGRGELVVLPNGTQVIPHDVSMAYAQAAASAPTSSPTSSNLNTNVGLKITGTDSFSNDLLKGISVEIDSEWSQVSASTTTQWQAIQTFLKTTWTAIKSDASSDWAALENMITSKWGAISNGTANSWNTILAYLRKTWQSMLSESLSSWTGMRDGVQSILGGLYGVVTSGFSPSLRYIQGLSNTLYGYGTNMINELARGVRDTAGGVTGAIEDLVETLKSKFIEGFEIHSPSHFTYYVGTMLGKGLINSLRDSHLASFVDSMIAEMKNSFSQGKLNLSAVMSFMGDKAPDLLKELGITLGGGTGIMGAGGMVWPSDFTEITSWFGNRPYPGAGGSTNHGGLDIGASMGSNVYAALGGTITSSGWNGGYGNAITIDHGNGLSTLYGHMSQLIAGVGQMVAPGQVIGLVGSTGNSTGPHLHFETRMNGERMDPASFFGFSVGSRDVPQDMIAWVHKHEAIIPADEMEKLKRLTNPRAPYRNSHGDILPGLNTRFANSAQGFNVSSWDETWTSQGGTQGHRRQVPDIKVEVTSVMDGRKVGYGSARYVNEKNMFDEKRRNRIGGIV